eukprot:1790841-Rhodomonas_salina.3
MRNSKRQQARGLVSALEVHVRGAGSGDARWKRMLFLRRNSKTVNSELGKILLGCEAPLSTTGLKLPLIFTCLCTSSRSESRSRGWRSAARK